MAHQTMSAVAVQSRIDVECEKYTKRIDSGELTLSHAHTVLTNSDAYNMDLFKIAGLAKAFACFQCSAD
ncbi:hypothetical protein [Paraburkholderia sp. A3RO-2L]|uniref:hypothetical protein n=1 Tax=Paraburkholderia sp. A3RO-2L TaxID=3028376 RepID=UPI003DA97CA6